MEKHLEEKNESEFSRTRLLLGGDGMRRLEGAKVAVFGVGGVGSYAVEALARSGVGSLVLVDADVVSESNINRQLVANYKTVGLAKVQVARERVLDVNPHAQVTVHEVFFTKETAHFFDFSGYSYIIDAIDTVSSKLLLIEMAKKAGTPIISSMGAGNKLDPTQFQVADISETSVCPLARVMRQELRKRGIEHVKVVYSQENVKNPDPNEPQEPLPPGKRATPGSVAFVPSVAGLIAAGEVIRELAHMNATKK